MDQMSGGSAAGSGQDVEFVKDLSIPLYQAKGWMKLLGVLMIIAGILYAITLVGIIVCWLPIWMGILLFKTAGAAEVAQINGSRAQLHLALSSLKTYFTIQGVLVLISLIFMLIGLIIGGGGMLGMLSGMR